MSWQGIEGHDAIVERFRSALETGRLASSFLFVGPRGVGKRSFALKLAQALLCQKQGISPIFRDGPSSSGAAHKFDLSPFSECVLNALRAVQ